MSKSKKSKKTQRRPNLSPLSMLRPRLDKLWGQAGTADQSSDQIAADLTKLTTNIQPQDFLPILVRAYGEAPSSLRVRLDEALPRWLQEQQYMDPLSQMITRAVLQGKDQQIASTWLQQGGIDVEQLLQKRPSLFYSAYLSDQDEESTQALIWIFCYTNRRRNRVHGVSICTDSDMPWEGAASQVFLYPTRAPEDIHGDYIQFWEKELGEEIDEIDAEEAKQYIFHALHQNLGLDIRPSQELFDGRKMFMEMMAQLPDSDDPTALTLTEDDFDELAGLSRRAEVLMVEEKKMYEELEKNHSRSLPVLDEDDDWDEGDDWDDDDWDQDDEKLK